jgi:hypothetical protein
MQLSLAQLHQKGSQLSSGFSKMRSAQLIDLTELTFHDSAKNNLAQLSFLDNGSAQLAQLSRNLCQLRKKFWPAKIFYQILQF